MAVSKEVQDVLDKARAAQTYRKSTDAAMQALKMQNEEQAKQLADLTAKLQALPTSAPISDEDKAALIEAAGDLDAAISDQTQSIDALKTDIPANVPPPSVSDVSAPASAPAPASDVGLTVANRANPPADVPAPLMPNMAFNPNPSGISGAGAGQPGQSPAIETAGGFVVSGGDSTQRAPGSEPANPSSSVVVPADPDAKGPASTADVAKNGLDGAPTGGVAPLGGDSNAPPAPPPNPVAQQQADDAAAAQAKADQDAAAAKDKQEVQQPS